MKKKQMIAKTLFTVMAAGMAFVFSACSGGGSASSAATSSAAASPSEASSASEASPAAPSGGSVDGALKGVKLKIGTSGLFGPFSYYDSDGKTLIGYDLDLMKDLQNI